MYTHRLNELRVVSQRFLADERGSIPPTPVLSGERLRAEEQRLGDQRLRAVELSRRGTGFTLTPDMVGPDLLLFGRSCVIIGHHRLTDELFPAAAIFGSPYAIFIWSRER